MPYLTAPPRARFIDEACYVLYYSIMSVMGTVMFMYFPGKGVTIADVGGWLMALAGIVSVFGVIRQKYQIELGCIWFSIAGFGLIVAIAISWATADGSLLASIVPLSFVGHIIILFRRWNYLDTIADRERAVTKVHNALGR